MEALISSIMAKTHLDRARAEKAVGVLLNLVWSQGNQNKVAELFTKMPGAEDLAREHGDRLTRSMAGGMMGAPLATLAKLQSFGVDMSMGKTIAAEMLAHARKEAGDDLVRQVAGNIPGLGGYL
jgi:hypothetical protein